MRSKTIATLFTFSVVATVLLLASAFMVACAPMIQMDSAIVIVSLFAGMVSILSMKPVAKCGSGVIYSAALADHSTRAAVGTLVVPIGGVLDYVEVQCFTTLATTVRGGGLFEIENSSVDWKPFQFYSQEQVLLGTGGMQTKPMRLYVNKTLPSGSTITAYFTANNAATSLVTIMFHWQFGGRGGKQTYMTTMRGTAAVGVLNTWRTEGTITIPAMKGGNAVLCLAMGYGAIETIVTEGGLVRLTNGSADWVPTIFCTGGMTGLTTICGESHPHGIVLDHPLPSASVVTIDFAPTDNQSQTISVTLIWEG